MADFSLRLIILLLVCVLVAIIVVSGRILVARRRQQALAAEPLSIDSSGKDGDEPLVRILAFSSEDCRQCHTLQQPALERLLKQSGGDRIEAVHVDAVTQHDLTERYKVLTVPTTVVLDTEGNAHAVNYGFANTQKLQEQINAILGVSVS
ncbi:thioredoxin family protein [Dictyobacter formicarum]|uniref:Thiol reductase thioredoxin n=1 Tax=Dictyobacter formicarum TaxID=2778368 RepID=A0ABQ3V8T4_9CHLR|nr:thioredoxin family protein [Dictyobacter formicarum]GHO82146.1 thiol reductase thioredoxin [Dictyobacter formicarum]